jgi:hypothetical protein
MRYMIMHKTDAHWEGGAKPTPELIQRVGGMVGDLVKAGVLVAGEGLGPSSQGARVTLANGRATVSPGPFEGAGALPASYAMFRAGSVDEAADVAARFGRNFGDVVVDVRPVNEAWDLGFAPKPEGLTTRRYMAVVNAHAASEAGAALGAEQVAGLKAFSDGLGSSGAFLGIGRFEPSSQGKRLRRPGPKEKHLLVDGPFSETKELLGGFVTVEVASLEEAVRLARKYVEAVETDEVDVRGIAVAS